MDGFKQRIVGAIVLVSLAIIFIPMVFEKSHQKQTSHVISIPPEPSIPKFTIEEPKPPKLRNESNPDIPVTAMPEASSEEQVVEPGSQANSQDQHVGGGQEASDTPEATVAQKAIPQSPVNDSPATASATRAAEPEVIVESASEARDLALDAQGAPVAWAVQIGTFKNKDSALKIRDELGKDNTPAYVQEIQSGGATLVRVFAGPTLKREQADSLKTAMDQRFKVSSLVVRYKPAQ